jgi:hypothetical protein
VAWSRAGRVGCRCAAAIVAGFMLVAAASVSAAGPWKLEAGRTRGGLTLSAVSCTSSGWCAAVGFESDETQGLASKVYAESGNGTGWTVAPSSGPKASWLTGVSCVAPDWCQAVGWNVNTSAPLNEQWNGRTWSPVPSPVAHARLAGVSCTSRAFCMAVGDSAGNHVGGLVERWNGTKWSVVPSPRKGTGNTLTSVACVSPTWCAAVGLFAYNALRPGASSALVEVWNGKTWRVVPARNPALNSAVILYAIDCVSSTWCMAGGYGPTGALVEHWNGQAWNDHGAPLRRRKQRGRRRVGCLVRLANCMRRSGIRRSAR